MPRVQVAAPKKETAAAKRTRVALEAQAASADAPARRGEDDDITSGGALAAPAAPESKALIPTQDSVVKASEEENPFLYVKPSEDLNPLDQLGMVRRGIARANRGLANGLGAMQRGYVQSAGEYLWWATQGTRLKDAGFKSVEQFADPLDLNKQDVYRLRRAVPVYRIIGDLVDEALNERTIRELYSTIVDEKGEIPVTTDGEPDVSPERQKNLRDQFTEMKKMGRVNSGGAVAARKLLMLGEATAPIEAEPGGSKANAVDVLAKARRTRRVVDLELLREAKEQDPEAAKMYVDDLRRLYEAAAEIVG